MQQPLIRTNVHQPLATRKPYNEAQINILDILCVFIIFFITCSNFQFNN